MGRLAEHGCDQLRTAPEKSEPVLGNIFASKKLFAQGTNNVIELYENKGKHVVID